MKKGWRHITEGEISFTSSSSFSESPKKTCCCISPSQEKELTNFQNSVIDNIGYQEDIIVPPKWYIKFPFIQISFMIINVALLVISFILNDGIDLDFWVNLDVQVLLTLGGSYAPYIVQDYQIWRMVTATFLHVGIAHILMNTLCLLSMGLKVERELGHVKFFVLYIGSGVTGTLMSAIFLPGSVEVGASTAIFGMYGVWFVDMYINWQNMTNRCCMFITFLISTIISFAIGLLPAIDNFAHVGGLIGGTFLSMIFLPSKRTIVLQLADEPPIWRSNTSEVIRRLIGIIGILAYLIIGFYFLFAGIDIQKECTWCEYISCAPIVEGWCK